MIFCYISKVQLYFKIDELFYNNVLIVPLPNTNWTNKLQLITSGSQLCPNIIKVPQHGGVGI